MFIVAEDCEAHSLLKGQSLKLEEIGDDDEACDTECRYTLLKMRILAFLHTNPTIHLI